VIIPEVFSPDAAVRHSETSVSTDAAGPSGAKETRAAPLLTTNAPYDGTVVAVAFAPAPEGTVRS
jgi:hypothetical protein